MVVASTAIYGLFKIDLNFWLQRKTYKNKKNSKNDHKSILKLKFQNPKNAKNNTCTRGLLIIDERLHIVYECLQNRWICLDISIHRFCQNISLFNNIFHISTDPHALGICGEQTHWNVFIRVHRHCQNIAQKKVIWYKMVNFEFLSKNFTF